MESSAPLLVSLREVLLNFALPAVRSAAFEPLRLAAVEILVVGFTLFFRSPSEQLSYLLRLLPQEASSPAHSFLLRSLFTELARWPMVADLLREDEALGVHRSVSKREKAQKDKKAKEKADATWTLHPMALEFLTAVADLAVHDFKSGSSSGPQRISPASLLLLSLQREIVAQRFGLSFLKEYALMLLQKAQVLLGGLLASAELPAGVDARLDVSFVNVALRALLLSLSRKALLEKADLGASLLAPLAATLSSLDAINSRLPTAVAADATFLKELSFKVDVRKVIETKHPYPFGKNQLKETVSIPGAKSLALRFDSQSRTASSSSDVLQLFLGSNFDQPVTVNGNPIVFSGTAFPLQPIIVPGDTVTFLFSAGSRPDNRRHDPAHRLGFSCSIMEAGSGKTQRPVITHGLLDLEVRPAIRPSPCSRSPFRATLPSWWARSAR